MLVVAMIISALSGVSLVGYNRFQGNQGLRSVSDQLTVDLRQAQQKALSGEKPAGWCGGPNDQLTGWRVEFVDAFRYEIKGVCSDTTTVVDKTITLANSVTKSAGNQTVDFMAITGAANGDVSFGLRRGLASGNVETTVSVTTAGSVASSAIVSSP